MSKKKMAVFTICQNEPKWAPVWVNYYAKHFNLHDMYILDHDSVGPGAAALNLLEGSCAGMNVIQVHNRDSFSHDWLRNTVQQFQKFLLQSYEVVVFAEIDEILYVPASATYEHGLRTFISKMQQNYAVANGYEVVQVSDEQAIDWSVPLLQQRSKWYPTELYCKTLISKIPLQWVKGFHTASNAIVSPDTKDENLYLIHLHKLDRDYVLEKHKESARRKWSAKDKAKSVGWQNAMEDPDKLLEWYKQNVDTKEPAVWVDMPEFIKTAC